MNRLVLTLLLLASCATASSDRRANVRIVADEADAVLAILDARAAGREIGDAEWGRVFGSEGYVRLQKRERAMGRAFDDDAFREFVTSPELLAKRTMLRQALDRLRRADLSTAAGLALAYLPRNATITATIYPVIKPRGNSFVFENDAIFKYVEDEPVARFEETIAHELHHIGYGTVCRSDGGPALPPPRAALRKWTSAFGEGFAVLAAAGGLHGRPYAAAAPDVFAGYSVATNTGWWNPDVIEDAANGNPDQSGYQFTPEPQFDFGVNGTFGAIRRLLIAQQPTISLTYETSHFDEMQQVFQEHSSWGVSFLGIALAGGSQSYYASSLTQDAASQTVTVTMTPVGMTTPVAAADQLAYVIGAEMIWPGGSAAQNKAGI